MEAGDKGWQGSPGTLALTKEEQIVCGTSYQITNTGLQFIQ